MSVRSYPRGLRALLGYHGGMDAPTAELSSLATALDDLTRRVTSIADALTGTEHDLMASELFEVERSLSGAQRRLARLLERAAR